MRSKFPGFYAPNDKVIRDIWRSGLIVPDANVLLHFFRHNERTTHQIRDVFRAVRDRLWIPHRAALEFQKRRLDVIASRRKTYDSIVGDLNKLEEHAASQLGQYSPHPVINTDAIIRAIRAVIGEKRNEIIEQKKQHPKESKVDAILKDIDDLFGDQQVGDPIPADKLSTFYKEGQDRYARGIPPGFRDASKKDDDEKYGDLIIWKEILDKAKLTATPILFITDDRKEDWWRQHDGKIIGPRHELIEEFEQTTKQHFLMYSFRGFLENARTYIDKKIPEIPIEEPPKAKDGAKLISDGQELLRREIAAERARLETLVGMIAQAAPEERDGAQLPWATPWQDLMRQKEQSERRLQVLVADFAHLEDLLSRRTKPNEGM